MAFKDDLAADVAHLLSADELAVRVEYEGVPVNALAEFGEEWTDAAAETRNMLILAVSAADVPAPRNRDGVVMTMPDGTVRTWRVDRILGGDGFMWRLLCFQEERPRL